MAMNFTEEQLPTSGLSTNPAQRSPASLSLRPTNPLLLRVGIGVFLAGVLVAAALGIASNAYPQGDAIIEFFRRCGLLMMLVGMCIILFCFPTARRLVRAVVYLPKTRSGRLMWAYALYSIANGGVLLLWLMATPWTPLFPLTMLNVAVLIGAMSAAPRSALPFFRAALAIGLPLGLLAAFLTLQFGSSQGWLLVYDRGLGLMFVGGFLIQLLCGLVSQGTAWLATRIGGEEDAASGSRME